MSNRNRAQRRANDERHKNKQVAIRSFYNGWIESLRFKKFYRKRKAMNCGRARCCMCMNDRRNPWHTNDLKLTMAERRVIASFEAQMDDYNNDQETNSDPWDHGVG